ncbi:hypothetical protein DFJ63DRAFT_312497 [Scheffersomyces coipomensis]|uniref:uncharacterized protein n=1 Tax=Scheffersomyces coipomensis TaxID=1788519 RepID=UPI00315D75D4
MAELDHYGVRLPRNGDLSYHIIKFCSQPLPIKRSILQELKLKDLLIFLSKLGTDESTFQSLKWYNKNRLELEYHPPPTITNTDDDNYEEKLDVYLKRLAATQSYFNSIRHIGSQVAVPIHLYISSTDEFPFFYNILDTASNYDLELDFLELKTSELVMLKRFEYYNYVTSLNLSQTIINNNTTTLDLRKFLNLQKLQLGPYLNLNIKLANNGIKLESLTMDGRFNTDFIRSCKNLKRISYNLGGESFSTKVLPTSSLKHLKIWSDFRGGKLLIDSFAQFNLKSIELNLHDAVISPDLAVGFPPGLTSLVLIGPISGNIFKLLPKKLRKLELISTSTSTSFKLDGPFTFPDTLEVLKIKGFIIISDFDTEMNFPSLKRIDLNNTFFIRPLNEFKFNKNILEKITITKYGNSDAYSFSNVNFSYYEQLKEIKLNSTNLVYSNLKLPTSLINIFIRNESIPEITKSDPLFSKNSRFPLLTNVVLEDCGIQKISPDIHLHSNVKHFTLFGSSIKSFTFNSTFFMSEKLSTLVLGCVEKLQFAQNEHSDAKHKTNLEHLTITIPNQFNLQPEFYSRFQKYFGKRLKLPLEYVAQDHTQFEFCLE